MMLIYPVFIFRCWHSYVLSNCIFRNTCRPIYEKHCFHSSVNLYQNRTDLVIRTDLSEQIRIDRTTDLNSILNIIQQGNFQFTAVNLFYMRITFKYSHRVTVCLT